MSPELLTALVGLASYATLNLVLTAAVCVAWSAGLRRRPLSGPVLLGLRLLPAAGGAFLTVAVCIPAFVRLEPAGARETAGPLLVALSMIAVLLIGHGVFRGCRAAAATRALLLEWTILDRRRSPNGLPVQVVDLAAPLVAVVGAWRPRLIVGRCVAAQCTAEEFARIVAHEEAHAASRDNFTQLVMAASPDGFAWLGTGRALEERWRLAAEHAADERATGGDSTRRVLLASALVRVARLAATVMREPSVASRLIGVEGIEDRVRRLLGPPPQPCRASTLWISSALLVASAVMAIGAQPTIHAWIEAVVGWGR